MSNRFVISTSRKLIRSKKWKVKKWLKVKSMQWDKEEKTNEKNFSIKAWKDLEMKWKEKWKNMKNYTSKDQHYGWNFFFFFTSEVKAIFEFQGIASQVFPLMLRIHENFSIFSFDRGKRRCAFMGRKPVENAKSRWKRQREKAALISYLGKEMSGVNGDRCGRKARNTHCPEIQQVLRLGSQKRGVRGRAWACAARGILAADSAGSRGHGACHTRTRGFLRHLIDRRFKRYCRRGLEDITGGEPLMIIGNICAVCSITTKC